MKLPKLNARTKIIAVAAGTVLLAFLMNRFILSAMRARIRNLDAQIRASEADLKIGLQMQKRKDKIQDECVEYKGYLKISAQDPQQKVVAEFISEVENIAREAGISVTSLMPGEHAEAKGYRKYDLQLRAESSLDRIYSFLHKIQTSRFLIKIDRFAVSSKDPQAENFKLDTTISMAVL